MNRSGQPEPPCRSMLRRRPEAEEHREVITTSKALATALASLARSIRDRIKAVLEIETEKGVLTQLMNTFREALIHDLDKDGFADMYAQTIAYGLLSARITNPTGRTAGDVVSAMPVTNPFLKNLMETFLETGGRKSTGPKKSRIDFDELGVNDVIELLDAANMEAVVRDFGDQNPQEDPVIHFYEHFLTEYDARTRMQRGVFYTPRPVVSYIVRSVDELLRTEFGLADGLADTTTWGEMAMRHKDLEIPEGASHDEDFVQILDPATGTGTFLVEVIDIIHKTLVAKWKAQGHGEKRIDVLWNEYVPKHLLTRLHGYELLMAPYSIAHMKIGLKLYETGYRFESDERARIYLTNALEPAQDFSDTLSFAIPALPHEAEAVNAIKHDQRFTVVLGNPPYSGISSNMAPWIDGLLKGTLPDGASTSSYYHVDGKPLGERKLWLQDDYVKFIRLSQHCLQGTGVGIHGLITNHGYLDNPTFRGMRWSLMEAFDDIRVLDTHGNTKKKEIPPEGGRDVNVFEIQQGVGIGLFVRRPAQRLGIGDMSVHHADLWSERERKYEWLGRHSVGDTEWQRVAATDPFYLFRPYDQSEAGDYQSWPAITNLIPVNVTGIVTARDDFVIDFDRSALKRRISDLRDTSIPDQVIRQKYFHGKGAKKYPAGDSRGWKLSQARQKLREDKQWDKRYTPVLYRPFDIREIYYVPWMVDGPRTEAMAHMLAGENLALITSRMTKGETFKHVQATRGIVEVICMSPKTSNNGFVFPLYLYGGVGKSDVLMFHTWPEGKDGRRPNLDPDFVKTAEQATGLAFQSDGRGDLRKAFGPEDMLAYIYAVFHCPEYRRRFEPMLKIDFPRVPPPGACKTFAHLARLGHELLSLHLLESKTLDKRGSKFIGEDRTVSKVGWTSENGGTVWIDGSGTANNFQSGTSGFMGVPEEVWNFHIGGYQVCEKWLKDRQSKGGKNPRPGRVLTNEDLDHYKKIIVALSETIRIMTEIDKVIDAHGGWPEAFQEST